MSAPLTIYIQIALWTVGMLIFSQLLSKKFGLSATQQMEMQTKMQEFQDRAQLAQSDPAQAAAMQQEMMQLMQTMMKKQLIPSCIRMVFFLGFIGLLGALYGKYDELLPFNVLFFGKGWFGLYFLISLGLSLLMGLVKMIYYKIFPEKAKKKEQVQDTLRALQQNLFINQNRMGQTPLPQRSMGFDERKIIPLENFQPVQDTTIKSDAPTDANSQTTVSYGSKNWKAKLNQNTETGSKSENKEQKP